jgi:peptide deformylase
MLLKVRYYGDPILRKRCEPIDEITEEIRQLARDMIETMDRSNGCGLAAPQVGHSIRLFVIRDYIVHDDGHWTMTGPKVFINPKLSSPGSHILTDVEGCLSLPGLRLDIDRPDRITIEAQDLDGNKIREEVDGYNARIRMHENDHINGVLFVDRVDQKTRHQIDPLLRDMKKKYSS